MRKILLAWIGLIALGAVPALAQNVQVLSGGCGTGKPTNGSNLLFTDASGNLCQGAGATASATTGTAAAGTAPTYGTQVLGQYLAPTQLTPGQSQAQLENSYGAEVTDSLGVVPTYSAAFNELTPGANPTDMVTIYGSATKTIQVLRIEFTGVASAAAVGGLQVIKRSTVDSGGTSTNATVVPVDANDAAGTATVAGYTAPPGTLGATVGLVKGLVLSIPTTTTATEQATILDFTSNGAKPLILRGVVQGLAVSFAGSTFTGLVLSVTVVWRETS